MIITFKSELIPNEIEINTIILSIEIETNSVHANSG